jgi:RNA polymerase sigma factor (sigma-70 family)
MPEAPDDPERTSQLLARVRAGDRRADYKLWLELRRHLLVRVQRHPQLAQLRPQYSAEDVVQEVWLRVQRPGALAEFEDRGPGSLRRYLGSFLENTLLDLLRRKSAGRRGGGKQPHSLDQTGARTAAHSIGGVEASPTSEARVSEVNARIQRELPEREREVWRLHVDEGHGFRETGEALGLTEDAARSLYFRARHRLQQRFRGDAPESSERE